MTKLTSDLSNISALSHLEIPNLGRISTPHIVPTIERIKDQNLADEFYKRLKSYIISFENELNEEQEVGAKLVTFGQAITFHIEDIGYWNPSLITFMGTTDDGQKVKLVQHVSQISVLLMAVKRTNPDRERIGYKLSKEKD